MSAPITVDFFFAPTSRYAYLASTRMLQVQLDTGCRVDWYPLHLRDLQQACGLDMAVHGRFASGQYDPAWRRQDAEAWAELYGVAYRDPVNVQVPEPRRLALACVAAKASDAGQVFARALFNAIYVDGLSPLDDSALGRIAEEAAGISADDFVDRIGSPETEAAHAKILQRARAAGCFGVPSFVVQGRMIWGNDRLPLLVRMLEHVKRA